MSDSSSSSSAAHQRPHSSHLRGNLRLMLGDATAFNVMVGIGETYFSAFALALGKGDRISGLVATVPMLAGAILQLISPQAIAALGSYRKWVATCATIQALSLVPMAAFAFQHDMNTVALFVAAAIYWGAGQATIPAWNTWVEVLVPTKIRTPFLAYRTRLAQFGMLAGVIGGGLALQSGRVAQIELDVFGIMFVIAALARFISATCLGAQSDSAVLPHYRAHYRPETGTKPPRMLTSSNKRLLAYVFMMQGAVYFSGPYFAAYMLKHLGLSYQQLVMLIASSYIARILVLPYFGRFASQYGAHKLLWIGAIGITPLPAMWWVSNEFWFLLTLQIVGGFVWAAHELAMSLLFIDAIPRQARINVLAIYNFGNSAAMATGTILGAIVLARFEEIKPTYLAIFGISTLLRIVALGLLKRVPPGAPVNQHDPTLDPLRPPEVPLLERVIPATT